MGNTFPSKKRIPARVHSPAFSLWRDPLFPSEIKGSRQIKNAFLYREKWRARTVGECYPCHETVPDACAPRNIRVHAKVSFLENQPASTISSTDTQSRYAPAWGKLYSRKFAICFTPISMGVNGLMCTGAWGSRVCPYSYSRYQNEPMENKPK